MGFFWFSNAVLFKCYYVHWKKSHSFGKIYRNDVDTFMFKNFDKVCYLSKSYTCLFSCWCINAFLIKPTENLNSQAINTYWCIVHVYTKSYTFIYQVLCTRYVQKRRNSSAILYIFWSKVTPFPFEIFIGVNVRLLGLKPVQMKWNCDKLFSVFSGRQHIVLCNIGVLERFCFL